jgi:hypothetical protein
MMRRGEATGGTGGPVKNNLQEQLEWLHKNHAAALAACFSYSVGNRVAAGATDFKSAAPSGTSHQFAPTPSTSQGPGNGETTEDDLDLETRLAAEAMLMSESWDQGPEPEAYRTSRPSNQKSYFPSSAADFEDDFEPQPPPFFSRQHAHKSSSSLSTTSSSGSAGSATTSTRPSPAPSFKDKGKAHVAADYEDYVAEEEEVIDLTQEPFRAGDGTSRIL